MPNEGLVVLLFSCVGGHIHVLAICTRTLCLLIQKLCLGGMGSRIV